MTTLGPNTTPGTYEFQVLDLLHDPYFNKWNQGQIDSYINEARRQLVMDTGTLRSLQQTWLTAGQEQLVFGQVTGGAIVAPGSGYVAPTIAFAGGGGTGVSAALTESGGAVNTITFSNFGSGYVSAPSATVSDTAGTGAAVSVGVINVNTYDILGVHLYWGNERYTLQWAPFSKFSSIYRPYTAASYQRQPVCWAAYGDTTIFVGPTPDQNYALELDTIILPTPFVVGDTTTVDPIPTKVQDPIKFYAAYLAKYNAQSYGEADTHLQAYMRRLREVSSAYTRRIPDVYQN